MKNLTIPSAMATLALLLAACSQTPAPSAPAQKLTPNQAALRDGPTLRAKDVGPAVFIDNGIVKMAVNDTGELIDRGQNVGLMYVPTGYDSTRAGAPSEGWGVANLLTNASAYENHAQGIAGVSLVSFTSTASTAVSKVNAAGFEVTHDFHPSPATPNLYEIVVTIKNVGGSPAKPRYRRMMDWDIEPTPFSEYVTINRGTSTALTYSAPNGFDSQDPLQRNSGSGVNMDLTDYGPSDLGAVFDFDFATLDPGASLTFKLFYGATGNESDALLALGKVRAEVYSLGQSNVDGAGGTPNTFIFAFAGVGGAPIVPVGPGFEGFFSPLPIENTKVLNSVTTLGSPVPVRFRLAGAPLPDVRAVFAPGFPATRQVDCTTMLPFASSTWTPTTNNTFSYDAGSNQYTFNYKPGLFANCRELNLRTSDGADHSAFFRR